MTKAISATEADTTRFQFGENWKCFLKSVDSVRILEAEQSLKEMLAIKTLENRDFLDIGSGSGLFSLAARRLGANVHSFDYDRLSVACTAELKRRYFPNDIEWTIEEGSVLDGEYMESLGHFDIVYCWGVLHHTGAMWQAMENACLSVKPGGRLYIAVYNDQGGASRRWRAIKRLYCQAPRIMKYFILAPVMLYVEGLNAITQALAGHNPLDVWINNNDNGRGMRRWNDWIDWIGGYPFEVAKPDQVFAFYREKGFRLVTLKTSVGRGCNEFVFEKDEGWTRR